MSEEELITVLQAVGLTGLKKGVVWRAIREGRLPVARQRRPILLRVSDVLAWAKPEPPLISREELVRLYVDERQSVHQIARSYGKDAMVIHRLLVKYEIPRRTISQANKGRDLRASMSSEEKERWKENLSKSNRGKRQNVPDEDRERRRQSRLEFNRSPKSDQWYEKQHQSHVGEKCWRWKGGCGDYRGPNWQQQRRKARKRDKYTCQRCGITETELGMALDVHHIHSYRKFVSYLEANRLSNLICYCRVCHSIVDHATNG